MFYFPESIVYLWLIPVFLTIILPLTAAPVIILVEKLIAARKRAASRIYAPLEQTPAGAADHRVMPRLPVDGVSAYVSDGINSWTGTVTDISRDGIRLTNPEAVSNRKIDRLGVLLNWNGKCFPIHVKPQWRMNSGRNIGAKIVGGYWKWDEFEKPSVRQRTAV